MECWESNKARGSQGQTEITSLTFALFFHLRSGRNARWPTSSSWAGQIMVSLLQQPPSLTSWEWSEASRALPSAVWEHAPKDSVLSHPLWYIAVQALAGQVIYLMHLLVYPEVLGVGRKHKAVRGHLWLQEELIWSLGGKLPWKLLFNILLVIPSAWCWPEYTLHKPSPLGIEALHFPLPWLSSDPDTLSSSLWVSQRA